MDENIRLANSWVKKAESDLLNADNNLNSKNIPFDTVCFHCQQAAEKLLKAYLIAKGKNYPLKHDLLLLLEEILNFDKSAEELRDCLIILMPYAVEVRYPDEYYIPSHKDAVEARDAAQQVKDYISYKCSMIF